MLTIDFYKYAPTLRVSTVNGINRNIFVTVFHHSIGRYEAQLDLYRARKLASIWLKTNYGKIIIQLDSETGMTKLKVCNKKKMIRDFTKLGLQIKLMRGY